MSGARISQPEVTFTNVAAQIPITNAPQKVLMVGTKNSLGTAKEKTLIHIDSTDTYKTLFGNSQLTDMIDVFKKTNILSHLDVIALDPLTSAAATQTVVVTGTATGSGSFTLYYGNMDKRINVAVANQDNAETIAENIKDAINKNTALPVTATHTSATVTTTYRYHGKEGNDCSVMIEGSAPGISIKLTKFTNGAGDYLLDDTFFDVVHDARYQTVVWPLPDSLDVVKDFLEPRWNVKNNVLDGVSITCKQCAHSTALDALKDKNEKTSVYFFNQLYPTSDYRKGGVMFAMPAEIAASVGAFRSLRYTADSLLTPYLTTSAGLDQFGGPALGALPYFNTLYPFLPTLDTGTGFTEQEVEQLAELGGSVLGNNRTQTDIIAGEFHTTYKTDPAGNQDLTYKYLNNVDVQSIAREYFYLNTKKRFAQSRLTTGGVFVGRDMANEGIIRSFLIGLYKTLSGPDYVITQAGAEFVDYFDENLNITLDMTRGKITIFMKVCFVTQARIFNGTIEFAFSIT